MQIGLCLPHFGRALEPGRLLQVAQRADAGGLDSLWVTDHVIVPKDVYIIYREEMLDPLAVLAWLAGVTERIMLGTSVIILPYRSPLPVAKLLASVDALSGGRLIFGAGVGWMEGEFAALGVPFNERGSRTDEALELFQKVWTEREPEIDTRRHRLHGLVASPMPLQRPGPRSGSEAPARARTAAWRASATAGTRRRRRRTPSPGRRHRPPVLGRRRPGGRSRALSPDPLLARRGASAGLGHGLSPRPPRDPWLGAAGRRGSARLRRARREPRRPGRVATTYPAILETIDVLARRSSAGARRLRIRRDPDPRRPAGSPARIPDSVSATPSA